MMLGMTFLFGFSTMNLWSKLKERKMITTMVAQLIRCWLINSVEPCSNLLGTP